MHPELAQEIRRFHGKHLRGRTRIWPNTEVLLDVVNVDAHEQSLLDIWIRFATIDEIRK
jgi:hypothetical protein